MIRRLISLLALIGIFVASNCSKIPVNNDPIIGIWTTTKPTGPTAEGKSAPTKQEWIFNDAYRGRYHSYLGNEIVFQNDFYWSNEQGVYTISYPGTDAEEQQVEFTTVQEIPALQSVEGTILAIRE